MSRKAAVTAGRVTGSASTMPSSHGVDPNHQTAGRSAQDRGRSAIETPNRAPDAGRHDHHHQPHHHQRPHDTGARQRPAPPRSRDDPSSDGASFDRHPGDRVGAGPAARGDRALPARRRRAVHQHPPRQPQGPQRRRDRRRRREHRRAAPARRSTVQHPVPVVGGRAGDRRSGGRRAWRPRAASTGSPRTASWTSTAGASCASRSLPASTPTRWACPCGKSFATPSMWPARSTCTSAKYRDS